MGRPRMGVKSDSKRSTNIKPMPKAAIEEEKNAYEVRKLSNTRNDLWSRTVLFGGMDKRFRTTRAGPESTSAPFSGGILARARKGST